MSSLPFNHAKIDQISTRHVQKNSKYLKEFFEQILTNQIVESFRNPEMMRRFCDAINGLKETCQRMVSRREARFSIPVRRPLINPSFSDREEMLQAANDESEGSSLYNSAENSSPKAPPPSASSMPSPKTPERSVFIPPAVYAPRKPTANMKTQNRDTQDWEPQKVAFLGITETSKRMKTSTPRQTLPLDEYKNFRVTIESPDLSGVRQIEGDANVTSGDIDKANQIIGNISQRAGADVAVNNTVVMSTRNITIVPGKYQLYKVNRVRF